MQTSHFVVLLSHGRNAHVITSFEFYDSFEPIMARIRSHEYGNFKPQRFWVAFDIQVLGVETRFGINLSRNTSVMDLQKTVEAAHGWMASRSLTSMRLLKAEKPEDVQWGLVPLQFNPRSARARLLADIFPNFLGEDDLIQFTPDFKPGILAGKILCRRLSTVSIPCGDQAVMPGDYYDRFEPVW